MYTYAKHADFPNSTVVNSNFQASGEEYMKFLHAIDTWQSIRDINEIFWIAVPQLIMLLLNFVMLLNIGNCTV